MITLEEMKTLEAELPTLPLELRGIIKNLLADSERLKKVAWLDIDDLPGEIWRDIKGYEGIYQVSNCGRIKNIKYHRAVILKQTIKQNSNGRCYFTVTLCKNGRSKFFRVNRLVAIAFIPNPKNLPVVHHRDNNSLNNNDWNLEWTTHGENNRYAIRDGLVRHSAGAQAWNASFTEDDVRYIRKVYIPAHPEFSAVALAKKFGVHPSTIRNIIYSKTYKNVI